MGKCEKQVCFKSGKIDDQDTIVHCDCFPMRW